MKLKSERKPGRYDSIQAAKELAGYTLRITSNEQRFPKRYRFTVTAKLQEKALDILDKLIMANELYPNSKTEFDTRILYQKKARAGCRALMTLMEVAANAFKVEAGTLKYWTELAATTMRLITSWTLSDKERFKKYTG
jgi:predicted transcriptional regulator YdeE